MIESPHQLAPIYALAVHQRNVHAFLSMYHEDVISFDAWENWETRGLSNLNTVVTNWFGGLERDDERVAVVFDGLHVLESTGLATVTAFVSFAAHDANEVKLRSLQNRYTAVLKEERGGWTIVHEHTSFPIDNELRGLLHR